MDGRNTEGQTHSNIPTHFMVGVKKNIMSSHNLLLGKRYDVTVWNREVYISGCVSQIHTQSISIVFSDQKFCHTYFENCWTAVLRFVTEQLYITWFQHACQQWFRKKYIPINISLCDDTDIKSEFVIAVNLKWDRFVPPAPDITVKCITINTNI